MVILSGRVTNETSLDILVSFILIKLNGIISAF